MQIVINLLIEIALLKQNCYYYPRRQYSRGVGTVCLSVYASALWK